MLTPQQIDFLNSTYNKDVLQSAWLPLVKRFLLAKSGKQYEDVIVDDVVKIIQSKNSFTKQELIIICFAVLQNETIYKSFVANLPPYMPAIIEQLLWEDSMSKQEAEEITGTDLLLPNGNSAYNTVYKALPGLGLLKVDIEQKYHFYSWEKKTWKEKYRDINIHLSIPPALRNIIIQYYPQPEGANIKPVAAPDLPSIKVFDAETSITQELLRSIAYYRQDNIKYSAKGKPGNSGMNKMQRSTGIAEFFTSKDFTTTRTLMIAGLLYGYQSKNIPADIVAVIKLLFKENYIKLSIQYAPVPPYILTQLKGINYADLDDYNRSANKGLLEVLKALPVDEWVTAENIATYIRTNSIDIRPLNMWRIKNSIYYESIANSVYSTVNRHPVNENNVSRLIDIPYLKGNLFLFAAFGLVAISYVEPDTTGQFGKDWYSEYDGLQAVKLTHLGAYVLDLEKEYKPASSEPAGKLVFDEQALIVRAEGDTQLIDMVIGSYLEKLSATRYAFNAASFLKDCNSADDIKNKIAIFKQAAGMPLPPLWEAHLQSLVSNTNAINRHDDVIVFRLSSTNKDLQQLIVHDPVIKKLVLKAEQFHILVSKDNLSKFKSRMKELGYLV